jgi:hypothetical protein
MIPHGKNFYFCYHLLVKLSIVNNYKLETGVELAKESVRNGHFKAPRDSLQVYHQY